MECENKMINKPNITYCAAELFQQQVQLRLDKKSKQEWFNENK